MRTIIYIPPYAEPVSLAEMKNHLRVDSSQTADDALIASQTTAARDLIETATGSNVPRQRAMLATTFDQYLDYFPWGRNTADVTMAPTQAWKTGDHGRLGYGSIFVSRVPLLAVTAITYVDLDGNTQTLSPSVYVAELQGGRIYPDYQQYWPNARWQPNAVKIRYVAGVAATFTVNATTDVCTTYGRTFVNDDRVQLLNTGGGLPAGLAALTTYFVINASGSTFQLSLTSGGSNVDITSTGTGTHFAGLDLIGFETLRAAIKLLVGFWYDNRSAVDTGRQAVGATVLPFAVDALVNSQHA